MSGQTTIDRIPDFIFNLDAFNAVCGPSAKSFQTLQTDRGGVGDGGGGGGGGLSQKSRSEILHDLVFVQVCLQKPQSLIEAENERNSYSTDHSLTYTLLRFRSPASVTWKQVWVTL